MGSRSQILYALGLVLLRMVVFGAVLYGILKPVLMTGITTRMGSNNELVTQAILALMAIGFAAVMLPGVAQVSLRDLGISRERLGTNVALGLATFAVSLLIWAALAPLHHVTLAEAWAEGVGYTFRQRVQLVIVGVHVIFGEDPLFLGYLQPGLRKRFSPVVAIGLASLAFALYHANLSPIPLFTRFVWGVLYGVMRERTGSTIPSSIAHFLMWAVLGWI